MSLHKSDVHPAKSFLGRPENENKHRVNVDLNDELFRKLKLESMERGESMAAILRMSISKM